MKLVKKGKFNLFLEFILYSVLYTGAFLLVDIPFKSFEINSDHKILVAFIAIVVIYVLEKVLKPILITISTPITGVTFGLFYFVINAFILKLTDWIMGPKLNFTDIWILFFISIILAALNLAIEKLIIEPVIRKATEFNTITMKAIREENIKKKNAKKGKAKK